MIANKNIQPKHHDWVDYAKGLGIILVVYGHVARGIYNAGMIVNENLFKLVDSIIYTFHMPLFFFLAGLFFIGSLTKRGQADFVLNKLNTIIYPYIIWSILQGVIAYSLNGVTNFKTTLVDLYSILWIPQDQFWFLYTLFLIFIVYTILYKYLTNLYILFSISLLLYIFKSDMYMSWKLINSIFSYGVYFCGGILFSKYMVTERKNRFSVMLFVTSLFIFSQWYYHCSLNISEIYNQELFKLVVAFIGVLTLVTISKYLAYINFEIVRCIGSYSLEIYLVHVLVASGFRILMQKIFNIDSSIFHLVFGTLLGVFLSIIVVRVLSKLGFSFLFYIPKFNDTYDLKK